MGNPTPSTQFLEGRRMRAGDVAELAAAGTSPEETRLMAERKIGKSRP
jgi:hypothetical protein